MTTWNDTAAAAAATLPTTTTATTQLVLLITYVIEWMTRTHIYTCGVRGKFAARPKFAAQSLLHSYARHRRS